MYSHIQLHNTYTNISGNIVNNNDDFNERTNTLLYKNIPLTLYSQKGDVSCVWEVSWRQGQTGTYWPQVLLTIAALLSHSGCSTIGHWGPQDLSLQADSHTDILSPTDSNCNWNWVTQAVCGTWLYNCLTITCFLWAYASATITKFNHVHRSRWYSDIFDQMHLFHCSSAYLHWGISWLMARSRVNMVQTIMGYLMPEPSL